MLAPQLSFGPGNGHPLAGPMSDEVGFELGKGRENVEEELAHRVGGVVDGRPDLELDSPLGEVISDLSRVRNGPGQPIKLGNDEGIPASGGGKCLLETGSRLVPSSESVIGVNPVCVHAKLTERLFLHCEILFVSGATGVPDLDELHIPMCNVRGAPFATLVVPSI